MRGILSLSGGGAQELNYKTLNKFLIFFLGNPRTVKPTKLNGIKNL
jgi:hypothetical protein